MSFFISSGPLSLISFLLVDDEIFISRGPLSLYWRIYLKRPHAAARMRLSPSDDG